MTNNEINDIYEFCRLYGLRAGMHINKSDFGNILSQNGKTSRSYGYEKLGSLLENLPFISFDMNKPINGEPSLVFHDFTPLKNTPKRKVNSKKDTIFWKWAIIPKEKVINLAENLALKEKWYYGKHIFNVSTSSNINIFEAYPVLVSYLNYTFVKLNNDKQIAFSSDYQYATFNTGLVDKKYEYIYAFLRKIDPNSNKDKLEWALIDFVVPGENNGKELKKIFRCLPGKADYFTDNLKSIFYNPAAGDLSCDMEHILIENYERLPPLFFKNNCKEGSTTINGITIEEAFSSNNSKLKKKYFDQFKVIISEQSNYSRLVTQLKIAIELAKKRAEWNYKTAVPMYYPTKKIISLLLPLCLVQEGKADVALVLEQYPNGNYQGQTILPLDKAYSNSRLITRPDSDWLTTDVIDN